MGAYYYPIGSALAFMITVPNLIDFAKYLGSIAYRNLQFFGWLFQTFATNLKLSLPFTFLGTSITFVTYTINYPENILNIYLIRFYDSFILPMLIQTPEQYKIGSLISSMQSIFPPGLYPIVVEVSVTALGMLSIYLSFKALKILPFVS